MIAPEAQLVLNNINLLQTVPQPLYVHTKISASLVMITGKTPGNYGIEAELPKYNYAVEWMP